MPCSAITLSLGTIAGVVSVALLGIAFGTDNWTHIRVNRQSLLSLSEENNELPPDDPEMRKNVLYHTRTKGLFRTCFPNMNSSSAEEVSKDIYRSPVEVYCMNIDYYIPDEGSEFSRFSEDKKATIHMGRSMIALFIVSFLFVFIAFWSGIVGCWRRSSGNITATAILMMFVCLFAAGAMGLWHGVDYYEQKKLEGDEFPLRWPDAVKRSTFVSADWSYFLAWIGVGFALLSSIFFFSAALNLRNERDREIGQKMQYLYPVYPQKQQYAYSYAYPGPYYPSSQYGQYNY